MIVGHFGRTPKPPQTAQARQIVQNAPKIILRDEFERLLLKFKAVSHDFEQTFGRTWPRDPIQRISLESGCRTHPKLAYGTNAKAVPLNLNLYIMIVGHFGRTPRPPQTAQARQIVIGRPKVRKPDTFG